MKSRSTGVQCSELYGGSVTKAMLAALAVLHVDGMPTHSHLVQSFILIMVLAVAGTSVEFHAVASKSSDSFSEYRKDVQPCS